MMRIYGFCLVILFQIGLPFAPARGQALADLIITNAQIVTMDSSRRILRDGTIVIHNGTILAIGGPGIAAGFQASRTIDAGGGILMPGMINLHNHLPMVAFRGIGEQGVENVVTEVMFPLEKALLNRTLIRVAARQAALELVRAGVTTTTDMYYHEAEVARSVAEVGLRGVLGETVIGFPVVDAPEPYGGLAVAEAFIQEFKGHPLITPAVAPHAPYTVTGEVLMQARALADRYDVPILIHLVEFPSERQWTADWQPDYGGGISVIQYLDRIGFLSNRVLAAHVVHLDFEDIQILQRHGVGVAHNPKANLKDATGLAPGWEMFRQGLPIGLGTDGPMSSNQMDILSVMGHAARVARRRQASRTAFTPTELVEMATIGGARALDREDELGSLEVGKRADMALLSLEAPNMQPNHDPYATIAFAAYPGNVALTIVNGEIVMEDGRFPRVDMTAHQAQWIAVSNIVADFAATLPIGLPLGPDRVLPQGPVDPIPDAPEQ